MEPLREKYIVDGDNFIAAGDASLAMKKVLRSLGVPPDAIRRAAICMYEGEINMVIHAYGGEIDLIVDDQAITMILRDRGPGIENTELAMQEGWSTASDSVRDLGFGAGMGIPNMRRYADSFALESEVGTGTTVTMSVNLS